MSQIMNLLCTACPYKAMGDHFLMAVVDESSNTNVTRIVSKFWPSYYTKL